MVNVSETHVSYNGGTGGVEARPTSQQESYANEHHVGPVAAQTQHVQETRSNPELRASASPDRMEKEFTSFSKVRPGRPAARITRR